ncbi:hypothetical protein BH20ACT9_BH20ACT9_16810 [soil metagenome]
MMRFLPQVLGPKRARVVVVGGSAAWLERFAGAWGVDEEPLTVAAARS